MSGTLYGLGVGPGDPELMTVKAWRLISTAQVISYLCANATESTALEIAKPFLPDQFTSIAINMPMRVERAPAQAAYDEGCSRISTELQAGRDVVFLCEGDPFFYGSFIHIFERLMNSHTIVVVPGVTSISAATAELQQPLVERDEKLTIIPATLPNEALVPALQGAGAFAIIKVGRHFPKVKVALTEAGLISHATAISYATRPQQSIRPVSEIEDDALPYFTTIIVRRK